MCVCVWGGIRINCSFFRVVCCFLPESFAVLTLLFRMAFLESSALKPLRLNLVNQHATMCSKLQQRQISGKRKMRPASLVGQTAIM